MPSSNNLCRTPDALPGLGDLFHDAPVGIFHSTPEGRLLRANPAMAAMLGYASPEELVANVTELGAQVYAEPNRRPQVIAALLACDGWIREVIPMRRKDGGIITVAMKGRKLLDARGSIACLEGYLEDITALRNAQEELGKSAARWKALNVAGVVMVDNDLVTGMLHFSDGWKKLLGYADDEIDNWQTIDSWHAMLHPDEVPQILATLRADMEDGVTYSNMEHRVRCKDGRWKWVHVVGAVTERDATGTALRGSGVLTDITYLKQSLLTDGPHPGAGEELSTAAAWTLDDWVSQLTVPDGSILWLKKREALFLRLLADSGTTPLRRSDAVIGIYSRYDEAALHSFDMLLSRLRKKVESHTGGPFPLLTVHGLGYLFTAPLLRR
jgi:PAS domain S-box-containing protein